MINTLLGIKKEMTATYDSRGRRVGATVVEISPNLITQIKVTDGIDGYNAVQLGYGSKKSVKKPQLGHVKKTGVDKAVRWFKEIKEDGQQLKAGQEVNLSQVFSIGDAVKVSGVSKGKGFQGGVKKHGFAGGPKTHGQSDRLRAPGAIGSGTTPGRVYKGKKMAGHMGNVQVSVKNLEVVGLNKQKNLLVVKGGIPGPVGTLIMVTNLGRIKGYTPPPEEKVDEEEQKAEESEGGKETEVKEEKAAEEASKEEQKEEVRENAG